MSIPWFTLRKASGVAVSSRFAYYGWMMDRVAFSSGILAITALSAAVPLASCQKSEHQLTAPQMANPFSVHLLPTSDTTTSRNAETFPISFNYMSDRKFMGDSTAVSTNLSCDTVRFTLESRYDPNFENVRIANYKDFKLSKAEAGDYELRGLVMRVETDMLTGGLPEWYSVNLLVIPNIPVPRAKIHIKISLVDDVRKNGGVAQIDANGKPVFLYPEYKVVNTWEGTLDLSGTKK